MFTVEYLSENYCKNALIRSPKYIPNNDEFINEYIHKVHIGDIPKQPIHILKSFIQNLLVEEMRRLDVIPNVNVLTMSMTIIKTLRYSNEEYIADCIGKIGQKFFSPGMTEQTSLLYYKFCSIKYAKKLYSCTNETIKKKKKLNIKLMLKFALLYKQAIFDKFLPYVRRILFVNGINLQINGLNFFGFSNHLMFFRYVHFWMFYHNDAEYMRLLTTEPDVDFLTNLDNIWFGLVLQCCNTELYYSLLLFTDNIKISLSDSELASLFCITSNTQIAAGILKGKDVDSQLILTITRFLKRDVDTMQYIQMQSKQPVTNIDKLLVKLQMLIKGEYLGIPLRLDKKYDIVKYNISRPDLARIIKMNQLDLKIEDMMALFPEYEKMITILYKTPLIVENNNHPIIPPPIIPPPITPVGVSNSI